MAQKRTIMAIGAHADDIEMSMGGAVVKYQEKFGYDLVYVMCTNNMSGAFASVNENGEVVSRQVSCEEEMGIRKGEAERAAKECYNTEVIHLDYPQRHYRDENLKQLEVRYGSVLPSCVKGDIPTILTAHEDPEAVERVAELIRKNNPEVIITLGLSDVNPEHTCTSYLVRKAFNKAKASGYDGSLIFCITPAPMGFAPFYDRYDTFIDTTGFHEKKLKNVGYHPSQKPLPEKLDFRDYTEGIRCGCETAEPYIVCEIATVRTGEFTRELIKNNRYCIENWQKIFFMR